VSDSIPWWAAEPHWWLAPEYADRLRRLGESRFASAVDILRRHFDEDRWRDAFDSGVRRPVAGYLLGSGTVVMEFIASLGSRLAQLIGVDGLAAKVRDLRGEKGDSALLEVAVAAALAEGGSVVRFPPEGGSRSPDIVAAIGPDTVAVECKRLEREQWEEWVGELCHETLLSFNVALRTPPIAVQVELDPRLSEIRFPEKFGPELNYAFAEAIVQRIKAAGDRLLATPDLPLPVETTLEGMATIRIVHPTVGQSSSVTGCEISAVAQLRRLLQNGLVRAAGQIPSNLPGIVVVETDCLPPDALTEMAVDVLSRAGPDAEACRRVGALLVLPYEYIGDVREPMIFRNRHAPRSPALDHACNVLARAFIG